MTNKDLSEIAKMSAPSVTLDTVDAIFNRTVHRYVAKIAAMKITSPKETTDAAIDMGQWLLVELAQELYGFSYEMAFVQTVTAVAYARRNINQTI
jgi:hypothetical protein